MADDKERFRRALDFMKMLGISHTVVAPILRRLIKLYDNEWSLIEEENYRALADSYFEHMENKEAKTSQRVTRNMSRRATSTAEQTEQRAGKAECKEEEHRERQIEHKEDRKNEQVADADCTSAMERKLDTMKYEKEFPAGMEIDHIMESGSSQEAVTTSNGFSGALCFNTQVECVRYEEKRSTVSRQIAKKRQTSASPIRARSERSFASSSISVKEEPVEMASQVQKGQSVCQGILPTVSNKSLCVEKRTMEIVPLKDLSCSSGLGANRRREDSKQNKGALSAIAALYGSQSDEEADEEPTKTHQLVVRKSNTSCVSRDVRKSSTARASRDRLALVWQQPQQLAVVSEQPQQLALVSEQPHRNGGDDNESYRHSSDDISRGQELVPIRLVNDLTQDSLPLTFYYIPKNITFQSAYINFSLDRIGEEDCCGNCFGDCLKRYPPCYCARETGGEFAYNSEGLLRVPFLQEAIADKRSGETTNHMYYCKSGACPLEQGDNREPCKGHLMRKFVKECWIKCGCSMLCGNRVVQKGIRCKLQVFFTSKKKGWGVRTLEDLPPGAFVCEYVGEILTNIELDMRNTAGKGHSDHYPVLLDADWSSENILRDDELLCLDATNYGNVARFINHRCEDANLVDIPVEIESPDHHYYHIAFFTTRLVKAYEELTWDYCIDFDDATHPIKAFQCVCESKYCRGRS